MSLKIKQDLNSHALTAASSALLRIGLGNKLDNATAGIAQFPARENSRKMDAMTTPFPCLFLNHARVQENEAFSATNRGKR